MFALNMLSKVLNPTHKLCKIFMSSNYSVSFIHHRNNKNINGRYISKKISEMFCFHSNLTKKKFHQWLKKSIFVLF